MSSTTHLGTGLVAPQATAPGTPAAPAAPAAPAPHPRRRLLVGAALVGPVALAAQYLLSSAGLPRDDAGPWLAGLAEDPTAQTLSVVVHLVAMVAGIAGAATLALACGRRAPWLSGIAAALLAAGSVGGGGFAGMRLIAGVLAGEGGPAAAETWTAVQQGPPFLVLGPLVLMAVIGTVLATVALVRARADVTVWAAPAHLAGFVLASGEFPAAVSVLGEALVLAALVPVARAALRG
ncbi:hypothetical protein [Geodermatophilus normandii]|uniref:DUF4386 family protein n=1 Tax=Geodermatophilus normandii TaxID=1137989 RepID=A0A6P0GIR9_9ACTN|nr:hypothetical protein [Geodermatophilus normandii]NEM07136.1 hypothetical protein [Geodermatophilus normandii]